MPALLDVTPPRFLQLAGHPLRWQLMRELSRSDRTVRELTALLGEAQNLVSYHLGQLREAGVVGARRSSYDGRDAYYALDLARTADLLTATAGALHPGLRTARPASEAPPAGTTSVLFLCTGNSARSQMAEALIRAGTGGAVKAYSAGSAPKALHPNAVRVMRDEYGIDIAANKTKHFDTFAKRRFDWVISLCDRVREVCPEFPGNPETIHWSIADPSTADADDDTSYAAFQQAAAELESRIAFLLAVLGKEKK